MKKIKLTQDKFAIVDDKWFGYLNQFCWCAKRSRKTFYATRKIIINGKHTSEQMHRVILGLAPGDPRQADHRNHDGLINIESNLRIATNSQNQQNSTRRTGYKGLQTTSTYRGVCFSKLNKKWIAYIRVNRHLIFLGFFSEEIEAAQAYDDAAIYQFGEFANPNFGISTRDLSSYVTVPGSISNTGAGLFILSLLTLLQSQVTEDTQPKWPGIYIRKD